MVRHRTLYDTTRSQHRQGVGLDITACPGTEHLAAKERELCATLRMVCCVCGCGVNVYLMQVYVKVSVLGGGVVLL